MLILIVALSGATFIVELPSTEIVLKSCACTRLQENKIHRAITKPTKLNLRINNTPFALN